jgi:hypothetical protein
MDTLCDPEGPTLDETQMALYFDLQKRPKLYKTLHVRLLRLAADAGMARHAWDYLVDAAESAQGLHRLLIARAWKHPAEVLDPLGKCWVEYGQNLKVMHAPLRRREGNAEHLGLVRRRLLVAVQEEKVPVQEAEARQEARAIRNNEAKSISPASPKGAAFPKSGLGSGEEPAPDKAQTSNKKKRQE